MKQQLSKVTADIVKALGPTALNEFSSWKYLFSVVDFEDFRGSVRKALKQANIKTTPELESK